MESEPIEVINEAIDLSGDGGCLKRILVAGDESAGSPPPGSVVKVHYVGTLAADGWPGAGDQGMGRGRGLHAEG
jgi:hypothetical protein